MQFQGAFSDNVFKFLIIFIITASFSGRSHASTTSPCFSQFFSFRSFSSRWLEAIWPIAIPNLNIVVGTKILEFFIAIAGTIGLYTLNPIMLGTVLFFMSVQKRAAPAHQSMDWLPRTL